MLCTFTRLAVSFGEFRFHSPWPIGGALSVLSKLGPRLRLRAQSGRDGPQKRVLLREEEQGAARRRVIGEEKRRQARNTFEEPRTSVTSGRITAGGFSPGRFSRLGKLDGHASKATKRVAATCEIRFRSRRRRRRTFTTSCALVYTNGPSRYP